jgi:uncharacterized YigZ family protein
MKTIESESVANVEAKGSKFIAHLVPYHTFETLLNELREAHPKASHIVTAYRFLNEGDQIVESSSDDGEPRGCAGLPILNVLRGNGLVNSALLIVRYFGGTKLGTGGMVRAYTLAAKSAIELASSVEYRKMLALKFKTDYSSVQRIEYFLSKLGVKEPKREFLADSVNWEMTIDEETIERFREMSKGYLSILQ